MSPTAARAALPMEGAPSAPLPAGRVMAEVRPAGGAGAPVSLTGLLVLIVCQLIGEGVRNALHAPIPGPVIGLFLLAAVLAIADRGGPPAVGASRASLERTSETLISHMGLLFVPAGVGVIAEAGLLRQEWLPIVAALVGSTILGLAVTGLVMHRVAGSAERPVR